MEDFSFSEASKHERPEEGQVWEPEGQERRWRDFSTAPDWEKEREQMEVRQREAKPEQGA